MGRQIAGASAPSCKPGLCPCPCCINYPIPSSSSSSTFELDTPQSDNPELERFRNDTTTLLNRLRSHVLPNPAAAAQSRTTTPSSPASDIRISTSISASRAVQNRPRNLLEELEDRAHEAQTNMLPPRLGTPVPTIRGQPDSSLVSALETETLPPLPSSSSFHDRSVSTAIRARLEELDDHIARTMLRSERNRLRNSGGSDSNNDSMDRVNSASENSRAALSQARDAIRNALQHSERLERIAGVLRRQAYTHYGSAPAPSASGPAPNSVQSMLEREVRDNWSPRTIVAATGLPPSDFQAGTVAPSSVMVDVENARTQSNLDRSLADLRAASREIYRVINLDASERSQGLSRTVAVDNVTFSHLSAPSQLSRSPFPVRPGASRQTPDRSSERDTAATSTFLPNRPRRSRWLSGDSAGIPLSTQTLSTQPVTALPRRSNQQSVSGSTRPSSGSASANTSTSTATLSQASDDLRNSTVALARRVLAVSRATRRPSTASPAGTRASSSSNLTRNAPTSFPQEIRDIRFDPTSAGALYFPSDPESDDDSSGTRPNRRLAVSSRAPRQPSSPANQTRASGNPLSLEGLSNLITANIGEVRHTTSRPITGVRMRPENIGALRWITQESDTEDFTSGRPTNPQRTRGAATSRGAESTPPAPSVGPIINSATPTTAEELALLAPTESEEEAEFDEMWEEGETENRAPLTRRPLFRSLSRTDGLFTDGRVPRNMPRRTAGGWRQVDANGDVIEPNEGDESLPASGGQDGISRGNGRGWYWTPPAVAGIMNDQGDEKMPLSPIEGRDADGRITRSSSSLGQSRETRYSASREMVGR